MFRAPFLERTIDRTLKSDTSGSFTVKRYVPHLENIWEDTLNRSINGTFIHSRQFITYHGDRFTDFSLLVYQGEKPVSLLPAEVEDRKIFSHRGLTYAGWVLLPGLTGQEVEAVVQTTLSYFRDQGYISLFLKSIPEFYSKASQLPLEASYKRHGGSLVKSLKHYTVKFPAKIRNKGKVWGKKKALREGVKVAISEDLKGFWEKILVPNLSARHQAQPVHDLEEIRLLKKRFPNNIALFQAEFRGEPVAGAVLFVTPMTAHTQYIASTPLGRKLNALDLLISWLIEERFKDKGYFSMGTSDEPDTGLPNPGLVKWKESFGARVYGQSFYEFDLTPDRLYPKA